MAKKARRQVQHPSQIAGDFSDGKIHTEIHFWWKGLTVTSADSRQRFSSNSLKWLREEVKLDVVTFVVQPFHLSCDSNSATVQPAHRAAVIHLRRGGEIHQGVSSSVCIYYVYLVRGHIRMAEVTAHATPAIPNLRSCLQLLALICVTRVPQQI